MKGGALKPDPNLERALQRFADAVERKRAALAKRSKPRAYKEDEDQWDSTTTQPSECGEPKSG